MAFVLTYNTLFQSILDYTERQDAPFLESVPLFIMLGQRRCARDLKILPLKITITDNLVAGDTVIAKPNRWLNDSLVNILVNGERILLEQRSYGWCRKYWPTSTDTGTPKYYSSDYNQNFWFFVPTPNIAYPYEIMYYESPEFIDENTSTNFLTQNVPEVLLYACLLETAPYLKDDERIAAWQNYYDKARQSITEEDLRRIYDSYSKRDG